MDNSKAESNGAKTTADENPNNSGFGEQQEGLNMVRPSSTIRTPFTNLSQVDADLALARTLQEQVSLFLSPDNLYGIFGSFCLNIMFNF